MNGHVFFSDKIWDLFQKGAYCLTNHPLHLNDLTRKVTGGVLWILLFPMIGRFEMRADPAESKIQADEKRNKMR
jgi:hypothetical protein